jgi:hypothetical protein
MSAYPFVTATWNLGGLGDPRCGSMQHFWEIMTMPRVGTRERYLAGLSGQLQQI